MKKTFHLSFRAGDLLAIALVTVVALSVAAAFVPDGNSPGVVCVYQDGKLYLGETDGFTPSLHVIDLKTV